MRFGVLFNVSCGIQSVAMKARGTVKKETGYDQQQTRNDCSLIWWRFDSLRGLKGMSVWEEILVRLLILFGTAGLAVMVAGITAV